MTRKIAHYIIEYRYIVLIYCLVMTVFLAYQATRVKIITNLDDLAPQNHPYVQLDTKMNEIFGGHTLTLIGVKVKKGDIYTLDTLSKIHRITRALLASDYIERSSVLSITSRKLTRVSSNADGTFVDTKDFEKLFFMVRSTPPFMEEFKDAIITNDLIYGPLVSEDHKATLILASWKEERFYPYIFKRLREIADQEEDENHRILLGGRPVILGYIDSYTPQVLFLFGVTFLILFVLLFSIFRTFRGMLFPVTGPVMAVIWSIGLMGLFQIRMDSMSILIPFLILGVGISHAVQVAKRYDEEFPMGKDNRQACELALATLMVPALGAILTDMGGFAALTVVPLRMVQGMAVIAAFGMLSLFFTVFLLHPVLLSVLPPPRVEVLQRAERSLKFLDRGLAQVVNLIYGRMRWLVYGCVMLLIIGGIFGLKRLEFGGQQLAFWSDSLIARDQRELMEHFRTGIYPYYLYIEGPNEKYSLISYPETLRTVVALQNYLESRPEVGRASSIADAVRKTSRGFNADDPRFEFFPDNDKVVGDYMYVYSISGDPGSTDDQIDYDYRQCSIQVLVKDIRGEAIKNLISDTEAWIAKNKPSIGKILSGAGFVGVLRAVDEEVAKSDIINLTVITLAVFTFVCAIYFSFMAGILLLIPLWLGNLITMATMGFSHIHLYTATIPVASLGMGLGVDYGLYLTSRLKKELRVKGQDEREAYIKALTTSGKAVFFTAASVALGIVTWRFSGLKFHADMGLLLIVILLANMCGALILLPALYRQFKPRFLYGEPEEEELLELRVIPWKRIAWITAVATFVLVVGGLVFIKSGLVEKGRIYTTGAYQANLRGLQLEKEEKIDEAEDSFDKAISLYPNYSEAHCNLGRVFYKQSQYQREAAKAMEESAKSISDISFDIVKGEVEMFYKEAKIKLSRALAELDKALEIDPANQKASELRDTIQKEIKGK